jgi:hypothetical protein
MGIGHNRPQSPLNSEHAATHRLLPADQGEAMTAAPDHPLGGITYHIITDSNGMAREFDGVKGSQCVGFGLFCFVSRRGISDEGVPTGGF